MTLKPIPRWLETLIGAALGVLSIPLLVPLFLWLYLDDWWHRRFGPKVGLWQRRFAWWPVELGYEPNGEKVWLEMVERTRFEYWTVHRRPGDEAAVTSPWNARWED